MDPDLYRVVVAEFTREWNRLQAEASAGQAAQRKDLERVCAQVERGVDAILAGSAPTALMGRLEELEQRKLQLEAELAAAVAPAPRLHPGLAEVYRDRVTRLTEALAGDDTMEVRDLIRGLMEQIRLVPEDGRLRIEVRGELGAILRLAEGGPNAKSPGCVAEAFMMQIKRDAGTRFGLCRTAMPWPGKIGPHGATAK